MDEMMVVTIGREAIRVALLCAMPQAGSIYLWLFARFAEWIGAPVQPELIWV